MDQYQEYNLINAGEVRTIPSDQALIVSGNRQPIKVGTTPYFENWSMERHSKKGRASLPLSDRGSKRLQYIELKK